MEGNPQAGRLTSYLAYLASGKKGEKDGIFI